MRRKLLFFAAIAAVSYALFWAGSVTMRRAVVSGSDRTWPVGLGRLADVPGRYPRISMSSGAARLIALARPLGVDLAPRERSAGMGGVGGPMAFVREQLDGWVTQELQRATPHIEPMPSESGEFLAAHAGDLASVRQLLLSNESIVWPQDVHDPATPLPALLAHVQLGRIFVGSALDRARVGDAGGWYDLRAAWRLSRILAGRPDVISNLVALSIARRVNGAARKMTLPAPPWFDEMQTFDFRRVFIAAYQAAAWSVAARIQAQTTMDEDELLPREALDAFMTPYTRMAAADMAEGWRVQSAEIAASRVCDFDRAAHESRVREEYAWWNFPARDISTPNLTSMWLNLFRFTAEREATLRALRLRAGLPPLAASECSGGHWIYAADGRSFRFSRKLPEPAVRESALPVSFSLE